VSKRVPSVNVTADILLVRQLKQFSRGRPGSALCNRKLNFSFNCVYRCRVSPRNRTMEYQKRAKWEAFQHGKRRLGMRSSW